MYMDKRLSILQCNIMNVDQKVHTVARHLKSKKLLGAFNRVGQQPMVCSLFANLL